MMAQTKKTDLDDFAEKILYGVNKALRKLVETSAANNPSLVVGDDSVGFKSVPAKELLKTLPKQKQ
jgi:lipid A disaccharide synthetase